MKRAEQQAETRERVLQAARAWFVERGFDATTIRDVAATAHVSVGTVHAHFVDKPALLRACLYDDIARAVARVWSSMDDEAPLLDQLTHCATVLYQSYAAHPELSRCMFAATPFPSPKDEPDALLRSFMAGI